MSKELDHRLRWTHSKSGEVYELVEKDYRLSFMLAKNILTVFKVPKNEKMAFKNVPSNWTLA